MKASLHYLCYFLAAFFFVTACSKKEWNETYDRPDWLADPIYSQLESRGNFTSFLKVIDKAGYKDILGKAGYWTLFAPNDEAFSRFLQEQNLSSVADISDSTAASIVKYALIYNAYRKDQLSTYQSPAGALPGAAYKRKTSYYDFVKDGNSNYKKIVDVNTNFGTYTIGDNNNKYIPYFIDNFMTLRGLTADDYNFFYPNSPYTGFNVADASVLTQDIVAENGIIHEIDRVILPLPSIDKLVAANPQYSYFKELLDQFLVNYQGNADVTKRYSTLTNYSDSVYTKLYSALIAFAPNNENYIDNTTSPQSDGYTLAVPTNDVLEAYVSGEDGILANFGSFAQAPEVVLTDLINAHMWGQALWPSKFNVTYNAQQELPTFNESNIIEKKVASNGIFYGINKVQDANVFRTVYSKVYLDPKYLLMNRAIEGSGIKFSMTNPALRYTVFMLSDNEARSQGYDFNTNTAAWTYTVNGSTQSGVVPQNQIYRILQTSVVQQDVTDLSGEGVLQTFNEEYIKYKNNKIYAAGNEDNGTEVTINSKKTTVNGTVYYTSGMLQFTTNEIGYHLEKLAADHPGQFGHFFNYLMNSSSRYNTTTKQILGTTTGAFYTIFVPTNAAIEQAVKDGLLPGDPATGVPDFTPSAADADLVSGFLQYHMLDKKIIAVDNRTDDALASATLKRNADGDPTYITITKQPGRLLLRDERGNILTVTPESSNNLSNRTLIHSIGKVLVSN